MARGVTVDELMQRAGRGAAEWAWRVAMGRPVTVLCGPGNNGGDGYVIAETLRARGLAVRIVAPEPPRTHAARAAREQWQGAIAQNAADARGGVFVDCLFGSGLSRPLTAQHEALLATLAALHDVTAAIDLPSGVATDDGALLGAVPASHITIALGAWKPAHFLMPAMERMGALRLVEIGIEPMVRASAVVPRPRFTAPPRDGHKYTRGLLGVVAGAMPGAALLAADAAMHAGAGYVKLLSSPSHPAAPASLVIDYTPLAEALAEKRWSALLVGPGLGRDEVARDKLSAALERGLPTVLDADALHLLDDDMLEGMDPSRLLLTPHEGELARLCEQFGVPSSGKVDRARGLAQVTGLTVLAKGPDTVLAAPDGMTSYFLPASTWLATAGTGDVLAGIAASRMAMGRHAVDAAGEAVWLHREAARIAGPSLSADDLARSVSAAYAQFL